VASGMEGYGCRGEASCCRLVHHGDVTDDSSIATSGRPQRPCMGSIYPEARRAEAEVAAAHARMEKIGCSA